MMLTKTLESRNAATKRPKDSSAHETGQPAKHRARKNVGMSGAHNNEELQSIRQELDTVRREHAKLQQAVYEAAQIQRKLCSPRELVWGDFEIAG